MSYEIASKVTVNANESVITLHTGTNDAPTGNRVFEITAQNVTNSPAFCTTDYQKVMYALFELVTIGGLILDSTVSEELRNADLAADAARAINDWKLKEEEHFKIFMDTFEGKATIENGKFVIVTNGGEFDYFYMNKTQDSRDSRVAKVFKTKEEALVTAATYRFRAGAKVYNYVG